MHLLVLDNRHLLVSDLFYVLVFRIAVSHLAASLVSGCLAYDEYWMGFLDVVLYIAMVGWGACLVIARWSLFLFLLRSFGQICLVRLACCKNCSIFSILTLSSASASLMLVAIPIDDLSCSSPGQFTIMCLMVSLSLQNWHFGGSSLSSTYL